MAKGEVIQEKSRTRNGGARKSATEPGKKKLITGNKKDAQHVIEQDGSWIVKSARSGRFVSQPFHDKREAIDAGRRLAQSEGTDLLIHGRSGQVFQHPPAISAVPDDIIRQAIRSANEKSIKKTASSRNLKKPVTRKK